VKRSVTHHPAQPYGFKHLECRVGEAKRNPPPCVTDDCCQTQRIAEPRRMAWQIRLFWKLAGESPYIRLKGLPTVSPKGVIIRFLSPFCCCF